MTFTPPSITYNVNLPFGGTGSLVGTITTDGTIGVLSSSNILSWNLTLNDGSKITIQTPSTSTSNWVGRDLSATTALVTTATEASLALEDSFVFRAPITASHTQMLMDLGVSAAIAGYTLPLVLVYRLSLRAVQLAARPHMLQYRACQRDLKRQVCILDKVLLHGR